MAVSRASMCATPRLRFNSFTAQFPRCELPERRPDKVGHRQWSNRGQRTGRRAVLRAHHCRSSAAQERSSKDRSVSGEPRIGPAIRHSWKPTAPNLRPRVKSGLRRFRPHRTSRRDKSDGRSAADYRGTTRAGGNVAALARTTKDTGTLWVATTTGRVFISKNADAASGQRDFHAAGHVA